MVSAAGLKGAGIHAVRKCRGKDPDVEVSIPIGVIEPVLLSGRHESRRQPASWRMSPCRQRTPLGFAHHSEAHVVRLLPGRIAQAERRAAAFGPIVERPASDHLPRVRGRFFAAVARVIRIRSVRRPCPLRRIPVHIRTQGPTCLAGRRVSCRRGMTLRTAARPICRSTDGREGVGAASSHRILFSLGRQAADRDLERAGQKRIVLGSHQPAKFLGDPLALDEAERTL